jgi:DNA-binding response OmpR family regulator
MQLLIAHGGPAARLALAGVARSAGNFELVECGDGHDALEKLLAHDAPAFAVVDWDLPGLDGAELCRLACQFYEGAPPYVILLAGGGHDIAEGLDAGASDCVRAPADPAELRARIQAGRRFAAMLAERGHGAATLVAERSPFEDGADADDTFAGSFELQSVLVAE